MYISSLVVSRRNKNICRYLPLFVNTRKTLYASVFVLFCELLRCNNLPACRRKACERPFCLFAAFLCVANRLGVCKYKQAQRKCLKSPKNRVYRRFFANHPPGYRPTRYQAKRFTPPFVVNFFCEKFCFYLYFSYLWILVVKYFHFIMILNFRFLFFYFPDFQRVMIVFYCFVCCILSILLQICVCDIA